MKKILKHPSFVRYGANTVWLVVEKLVAMLVGLFIGAWVARYLGPEDFGVLGYVTAFTVLLNPLLNLGLSGIVSRELVQKPQEAPRILATCAAMRLLSAFVYIVLVSVFIHFIENDELYVFLAFYLSLSLSVAAIFEVFLFYFRSRVQARYGVIAQIAGQLAGGASKVVIILVGAGLVWFAVSNVIGAIFAAFVAAIIYLKRERTFLKVSAFDFEYAKALIKESWPVMFSAAFVVVYLHIDKIMLKQMLGAEEVGHYAAATKITSIFFFLPVVIGWSLQPAIVKAHGRSQREFVFMLKHMMAGLALFAYLLTGLLIFSSDLLVWGLFGEAYAVSAEILKVHAICVLFVFLSQPRGLWVSTESHHKFAMWSNIAAGLINVLLNLMWIEEYGTIGAAWATVISYFIAFVGGGFLYRQAWWITLEQIKSLLLLNSRSLYLAVKRAQGFS